MRVIRHKVCHCPTYLSYLILGEKLLHLFVESQTSIFGGLFTPMI
jgi:hypothetical protein